MATFDWVHAPRSRVVRPFVSCCLCIINGLHVHQTTRLLQIYFLLHTTHAVILVYWYCRTHWIPNISVSNVETQNHRTIHRNTEQEQPT